jgi:hypothetical protein
MTCIKPSSDIYQRTEISIGLRIKINFIFLTQTCLKLGYKMPIRFIFYFLFLVSSCGLKYVETETPESFAIKRHEAIESHLQKELNSVEKLYKSEAFGKTEVIKPSSYRVLDSLYLIKYNNEKTKEIDPNLENEIVAARQFAQNDSNKVIYIENHFFSILDADTVSFYQALVPISSDLRVKEINIFESIDLPKKYKEYYLIYFFEESFLNSGYLADLKELEFYTYMKSDLDLKSNKEKEAIIIQTLDLMKIGNEKNTSNFNELMRVITSRNFHGKTYAEINEEFSQIVGEVSLDSNGEEFISGYHLDYSFSEDQTDGTFIQMNYTLYFDRWLRILKCEKK